MKIVAISGTKGGGGRTTVALNLAYQFAQARKRVLLVDVDVQGGIAHSLTANTVGVPGLAGYVLGGAGGWRDYALRTRVEDLLLIPRGELPARRVIPFAEGLRTGRLEDLLGSCADSFDIALLDTSAGPTATTLAALKAATHTLGVVPSTPLGLRSVPDLLQMIGWVREEGAGLKLLGLVPTMVDLRDPTSSAVARVLWEEFPDGAVFDTFLPLDSSFPAATEAGLPLALLPRRPQFAVSTLARLAEELDRRLHPPREGKMDVPSQPLVG